MSIHRNRLGNVSNGFQGKFRRVLCVCSAGLLRSPTLAEILSQPPYNFNTRAVGIAKEFALIPIDMAHAAWSTLVGMISYKSIWYGKTFHQIDRWYPSSKTCNCCGHKVDKLSLDIREWDCPNCGTHHVS